MPRQHQRQAFTGHFGQALFETINPKFPKEDREFFPRFTARRLEFIHRVINP